MSRIYFRYSEENGKGEDDLDEPWIMTVKSSNLKSLPDENHSFQNKKIHQNGSSAPSTPSLPKSTPSKTDVPANNAKNEKNVTYPRFVDLTLMFMYVCD